MEHDIRESSQESGSEDEQAQQPKGTKRKRLSPCHPPSLDTGTDDSLPESIDSSVDSSVYDSSQPDSSQPESTDECASPSARGKWSRKLPKSWLTTYRWMGYNREDNSMFCKICRKAGRPTIWATTGTSNFRYTLKNQHYFTEKIWKGRGKNLFSIFILLTVCSSYTSVKPIIDNIIDNFYDTNYLCDILERRLLLIILNPPITSWQLLERSQQ